MTVDTRIKNMSLDDYLVHDYFKSLVNSFFKILPMREKEESSLPTYLDSLQVELMGCEYFVSGLDKEPGFLSLLAILQYLLDNPDCPVNKVRREVFKAISICNKLKAQFMSGEVFDERVG